MFTDDQIRRLRDFLADKLARSGNSQGMHIHRREIEREAREDKGLTRRSQAF